MSIIIYEKNNNIFLYSRKYTKKAGLGCNLSKLFALFIINGGVL